MRSQRHCDAGESCVALFLGQLALFYTDCQIGNDAVQASGCMVAVGINHDNVMTALDQYFRDTSAHYASANDANFHTIASSCLP